MSDNLYTHEQVVAAMELQENVVISIQAATRTSTRQMLPPAVAAQFYYFADHSNIDKANAAATYAKHRLSEPHILDAFTAAMAKSPDHALMFDTYAVCWDGDSPHFLGLYPDWEARLDDEVNGQPMPAVLSSVK